MPQWRSAKRGIRTRWGGEQAGLDAVRPSIRASVPGGAEAVLAACLNRPTSMARDARTGAVYITELITGRLLVVQ